MRSLFVRPRRARLLRYLGGMTSFGGARRRRSDVPAAVAVRATNCGVLTVVGLAVAAPPRAISAEGVEGVDSAHPGGDDEHGVTDTRHGFPFCQLDRHGRGPGQVSSDLRALMVFSLPVVVGGKDAAVVASD